MKNMVTVGLLIAIVIAALVYAAFVLVGPPAGTNQPHPPGHANNVDPVDPGPDPVDPTGNTVSPPSNQPGPGTNVGTNPGTNPTPAPTPTRQTCSGTVMSAAGGPVASAFVHFLLVADGQTDEQTRAQALQLAGQTNDPALSGDGFLERHAGPSMNGPAQPMQPGQPMTDGTDGTGGQDGSQLGRQIAARTDANGHFSFEWPESFKTDAAGVLTVSHPTHKAEQQSLTVGSKGPLNITLTPAPGIRVTLVDAESGKPVPDAIIYTFSTEKPEAVVDATKPGALNNYAMRVWQRPNPQPGSEVNTWSTDDNGQIWIPTANGPENTGVGRHHHIMVNSMAHRPALVQNIVATAEVIPVRIELDRGASLSGRVVDQDGMGVPFAQVSITTADAMMGGGGGIDGGRQATTDLDGNFTVSGLVAEKLTGAFCSSYAQGYAWMQRALTAADRSPMEITLQRQASMSGRVKDRDGKFIGDHQGAQVRATRTAGDPATEDQIGRRGRGGEMGQPNGTLEWYWVNAAGAAVNEAGEVDKRLELPGSSGQFNQSQQTRFMGRGLMVDDMAANGIAPREEPVPPPGATRAFRLVGMMPGDYQLTAEAPQHAPTTMEVTLAQAEMKQGLIVQLKRGSQVSGRVLSPEGTPVAGAQVLISDPWPLRFDLRPDQSREVLEKAAMEHYAWQQQAITDESGAYSIAGLPAGEVMIVAAGRGIGIGHLTVALESEGQLTQDVTLEAGATISGSVVLSSGSAAANASVDCSYGEQRSMDDMRAGGGGFDWQRWQNYQQAVQWVAQLVSSAIEVQVDAEAGTFVARGLAPGRYALNARAPGGISASVNASAGDSGVVIKLGAVGAIKGTIRLPDGSYPTTGAINVETNDGLGTSFGYQLENGAANRDDRFSGMPIQNYSGQEGVFSYDPASGAFSIENIAVGTYTLTGSAPGYSNAQEDNVVVASGGAASVSLTLGSPFRLDVLVLDSNGAAIEGATVSVGDQPDNPWMGGGGANAWSVETDASGRAVFEAVTIPMVVVKARKDGLSTDNTSIDLRSGSSLELRLKPGGTVVGVVRDKSGQPLGGTMVMMVQPQNGNQLSATTDDSGNFRFEKVTVGVWMAVATALQANNPQDMGDAMRMVTVKENETATVEFGGNGTPDVRVSGMVRQGNEPMAGGTIGFFRPGEKMVQKQVEVDATGQYETTLAPGDYLVLIPPDNTRRIRVKVPEAASAVINVDLPDSTVSGNVRDRGGNPVQGARIELVREAAGEATDLLDRLDRIIPANTVSTDENGHYEIGGVAGGSYDIWVRSGGAGVGAATTPDGRVISTTHGGRVTVPANGGHVSHDIVMADAGSLRIVLDGFPLGSLAEAELQVRDAVSGRTVPLTDGGFGQPALRGETTTFNNLAPGNYVVRVHLPGAAWVQNNATISAGGTTELRFSPTIGAAVTVIGTGPSGSRPLASWSLKDANGADITPRGNVMELLTGSQGADGRITFADLAPGRYTVRITDVDGHSGTESFDVAGSAPMDVNVSTR